MRHFLTASLASFAFASLFLSPAFAQKVDVDTLKSVALASYSSCLEKEKTNPVEVEVLKKMNAKPEQISQYCTCFAGAYSAIITTDDIYQINATGKLPDPLLIKVTQINQVCVSAFLRGF